MAEHPQLKGYDVTNWFGLFVPAGTPAPIVDKLNAAPPSGGDTGSSDSARCGNQRIESIGRFR